MDDTASKLIDALEAEAEPVDAGVFTLDPKAAQARLAMSRHAAREVYLIPLVEGLRAMGALVIRVRSQRGEVMVSAPGLRISEAEPRLQLLFSSPFTKAVDASTYGMARLAIAIDMALGHDDIERVTVTARAREGGHLGVYTQGGGGEVSEVPGGELGVEVVFERPFSLGLGDPATVELELLRAAARYTDDLRPIMIEGQPASLGAPILEAPILEQDEGYIMHAGFEPGREAPAMVCLSEGLIVGTYDVPTGADMIDRDFLALVELERPSRDLSQMSLIRDATIEAALLTASSAWYRAEARRERRSDEDEASPSETPDSGRSPFLPLFFMVFWLAGIGSGTFFAAPLRDSHRMNDWVEVSAQLDEVRLEEHDSDDGGDTYSVEAHYSYTYEGRPYSGERVSLSKGSDNIGSYHQDMYARLEGREHVQIWVNPDNAAESIIDREIRWGLSMFSFLFPLLFGGIGGGGVIGWLIGRLSPVDPAEHLWVLLLAGAASTLVIAWFLS